MRTKLLLFAFAPALCLGQDQFQTIHDTIPARLTETKTPSLAIAVARDGKIIWEEGFGLADRENGVVASADVLYPVASLSKPFTATALMILVERGVLKLDGPANQYLGEAKLHARVGNASDATVRRLANHTAGLPSHYQLFSRNQPLRPPSMDETIRRFGNLVTPSGERYEYSNLGYGILGYIIERASRRSYVDFVQENVLGPLGVRHPEPSSRAVRYDHTGSPLPEFDTDHPGAAAIFASAHDLALFGLFHLGELPLKRPILTKASLDLMHTPMVETGPSQGYGWGWEVQTNAGYRTIFHKGGMAGATSSLHLIPEHHLVVAAVANSASPLPDEIRRKIIALMVPSTEVGPASPRPRPQPAPQGEWSGKIATYRSDLPLRLKSDGEVVQVALEDAAFGPLESARWRDGVLQGRMKGDLQLPEVGRCAYFIRLSLKMRGNDLAGSATAFSVPTCTSGFGVTQWVELHRDSTAQKQSSK